MRPLGLVKTRSVSPRRKLAPELREAVRVRAGGLCEYCHAAEQWQYVEFTVDHILLIRHGGATTMDNLAFVCFACNRRKWDRLTGIDQETSKESRLFHPRSDEWNEHFSCSLNGMDLHGTTSVGRATIEALDLNRERLRLIRAADVHAGRHPPNGDRRGPGTSPR
jgi:hypothetical protein